MVENGVISGASEKFAAVVCEAGAPSAVVRLLHSIDVQKALLSTTKQFIYQYKYKYIYVYIYIFLFIHVYALIKAIASLINLS